jgi:hypothetical protein
VYRISFLANQPRAGGPLRFSGIVFSSFGDANIADDSWIGVGLTPTGAPPATFADFSHFEGSVFNDAYWVYGTEAFTARNAGGVEVGNTDRVGVGPKTVPLDTNFAAGKYLWLVMSPANPPIGTTAPNVVSRPYLIR